MKYSIIQKVSCNKLHTYIGTFFISTFSHLTAGLIALPMDPARPPPRARILLNACSARSDLSSASSNSCWALRNLAKFKAAISSCKRDNLERKRERVYYI